MTRFRVEYHLEQLLAAFGYPLTSLRRITVLTVFSVATYLLLILSTFPEYTAQMLGAGVGYVDDAVLALTANTYATIGGVGLGLVVLYAMVTGIALTNAIGRLRQTGLSGTRGLSSVVPGLLVSGCASCGAGVLGLLGFAGALALLPFDGNLLRAGGLLLLLVYLARLGDPRECSIAFGSDTE